MGLFGSHARVGASAAGDYEIDRSLRFEGLKGGTAAGQLDRDFQSGGNAQKWTFAVWFKLAQQGTVSGNSAKHFIGPYRGGDGSQESTMQMTSADQFRFYDSGASQMDLLTKRRFRDPSAWMHLVVAVDTTQGTAGNRVKVYFNGVQETDWSTETYPSEDYEMGWNKEQLHAIGRYAYPGPTSGANTRFHGYMADLYWIDNQQLTPGSFGETDIKTGEWIPKKYGGTYGTTGFYLNFSDNSNTTATTLGKDYSGNGNNWTPANFSVAAGTGCDSMTDTPTNNFCTLNNAENGYGTTTYKNANLEVAASNDWVPVRGTMAVRSGKYYWEVYGADGNSFIGVAPVNTDLATINPMLRNGVIVYYGSDGKKRIDGTFSTYGNAYGNTNVIGVALDIDNGKLYFAEDNTWQDSGDPTSGSTGTGAINLSDATGLVGSDIIPFFCKNGTEFQVNFGQRAFTHTPPAGYKTLCSANLPDPTIKKPSEHFKTVLYTGNGGAQSITSLDFQPNLVWNKNRDAVTNHNLTDSVRGAYKKLMSNLTSAQADQTSDDKGTTAFLSNGFTVKDDASGNYQQNGPSGDNFVAWCWKASATAGYEILSYEGNEVAGRTVAHNLGVKPNMIIVKNMDDGNQEWGVYHSGEGATKAQFLEQTGVGLTNSIFWNDTEPTSSVFTVGTASTTNEDTLIAYVFADVEGFSKFGTYEGNGNADGTFVYCGFKPAYIVTKRVETTPNAYWNIFDNQRQPYNSGVTASFKRLRVESDSAEATNHVNYTPPDFLANGFKLRHGRADTNYSGKKFIFFAFAESPFKYANAR